MQITKENTGNLTATIKIELEPADYQEKVNTQLKEYQHKANMPGFRPGKVPFGLVKKMYGKALIADVIDKSYSEALYTYLQENNINVMAHPLPSDEINQPFDLDKDTNFVIHFDIAMVPEFTLNISDKIQVDNYKIILSDESLDKYVTEIRKRNGPVEDVDSIGEDDMVSGQFIELAADGTPKEDGIKNDSFVYMEQLKDDDSKKKLLGVKVNEAIELDPKKIARNEYEEAYFLGIKKEQLEEVTSKFQFLVKKITRTGMAELNEELYKKVYPNMNIETEEQFREIIRVGSMNEFAKESERKFMNDVTTKLIENHDFEMPDAFLKRYMLQNQNENGKLTPENIDAEYELMKPQLKWQLIENKIVKEFGLAVTHEDAKEFVKGYFRQGPKPTAPIHEHDHDHDHERDHEHDLENNVEQDMENEMELVHEHEHEHEHEHHHDHDHDHDHEHKHDEFKSMDDKRLDQLAETVLKNKDQEKQISETLFEEKMRTFFKTKISTKEIETTYEDFIKTTMTTQNL